MTIYASYDDEPEDLFSPLPLSLYPQLYDLELAQFSQDLPFYGSALPQNSKVLEVGCGTGRLTRLLAQNGHRLTGIDLSFEMLAAARKNGPPEAGYVCMDMCAIRFTTRFDAVIIPYNTLNLLADPLDIDRCLAGCHHHLREDGLLLLQIYTPPAELREKGGATSFQFQLFNRPAGGKVVKEILRSYQPETQTIIMEERYKIRPLTATEHKNYSQTMHLCGWQAPQWLERIRQASFSIERTSSDYTGTAPHTETSTLLLVVARRLKESA